MKEKILVVDDDRDIRQLLKVCLTNDGYDVIEATNGKAAIEVFDTTISLVVLDIMMPVMDGIQTCMALRDKSDVPILFLTAKTQDSDMILGLQIGADDYIKKPFTPPVLIAKIKAMLRRYNNMSRKRVEKSVIHIQDLEIDEMSHTVNRGDQVISLTRTEFDILLLLSKHKGQVFSIQRIYESIWNEPYYDASSNTVMVHIKKLRSKINDNQKDHPYIKTVWGVGYKID